MGIGEIPTIDRGGHIHRAALQTTRNTAENRGGEARSGE